MSGTPTNPETTDRAIVARDVIELYRQGIPGAMDAGVPKFLAEAVLALLTERDALKAARDEIESYGDLRVMRADLAEARSQLAYAKEDLDRATNTAMAERLRMHEQKQRAEAAEATLTRYRNALEQIAVGAYVAADRAFARAALDGPKEGK